MFGNPGDIDHVKPEMIDPSIVVNLNCLKRWYGWSFENLIQIKMTGQLKPE